MAGYRYWLRGAVSIVVTLMIAQAARSQTDVPPGTLVRPIVSALTGSAEQNPTCKVYSLSDLGDDSKLCKWVAETIPEVIQPASWKNDGVKLTYYGPAKVLVINQTPAVHAEVDGFLQSLKKSVAPQKSAKNDSGVTPVQFVPDGPRPMQSGASSYPVPSVQNAPKHLFHFIIRYEGEGIIDSNVVKFAKALSQGSPDSRTEVQLPPAYYLKHAPQYFPPSSSSSAAPGAIPMGTAPSTAPLMPPASESPVPSSSGADPVPPPPVIAR